MLPIILRFTPNKDDYVIASRAITMRQWSTWLILGIIVFIWVINLLLGLMSEDTDWISLGISLLPMLLFTIIFGGLIFVVPSFQLGRRIQKNKRLTTETVWIVDDQTIVIKNAHSESKMDWGTFQRVIQLKDYYLLGYSTNKAMAQILPRRAFESSEQETAFRKLLEQKIKGFKA